MSASRGQASWSADEQDPNTSTGAAPSALKCHTAFPRYKKFEAAKHVGDAVMFHAAAAQCLCSVGYWSHGKSHGLGPDVLVQTQ